MGSFNISRAWLLALVLSSCTALTSLTAPGEDDCALYLSGPGRSTAYDYTLNLLKGNFGYEGQHTCITYDAVNQAYLEARNRIAVSQPKGEWKAEDFASVGELILDISINLARRYGLTYEEIEKGLPLIDTSRTLIRDVCPPVFSHVECRAGKYRRLDGLCNNLDHPTWGSTMSPFQRLIGPLFSDGINAPRIAHTGRDLPLSRVVSRTMHPDDGFHDHAGTVMVIAWGQFMDHDYTLTGTPLDPVNRNDPEECCSRPKHLKHPYCNEIRIPDDDYFYRLWGVKCIDFVRAFPSPRPGCRLGSRVPFNTLTGSLDGNTVYGVTDKFSRKLRTGYGGLLRMNPVFKEYGLKDLLPLKLDIPDEGCTRPNKNMYCFEGGEIRVNEQLVLTVMHTLMAREHNRVAKALAEVNPHWDDETLFQEARRINVAEIQHITYNEFLPILLGKDVMEKFGLVLEKEGYWDGYDPTVNPDVIDAFASAAFRFGHSLLPTAVERWSKAHKFIASKRLSDLIRRPFDLYRAGVLDEYVMGLMNQVAQAMDDSITQEVTNHLFKKVGARFGMDLVSFNMQRGREFGIPGYMEFRKFCGLHGADTFQDLFGSMPNETVRKYETIFEHPIDVDLWSGGVSERPLPGSMLGPTFACVIATQFSYSRRGDRFWFELPNQPSSFTAEQLAELRKARLARVICDNTDIIDTVQLYPMVLPDHELNPRVPCRSGIIPSMDFSKWAEPAPAPHQAFITEAYMATKNETEGAQADVKDQQENVSNITAELKETDKLTTPSQLHINCQNITDQNCSANANDCTKCAMNAKETQGPDTIAKHVYKNTDKVAEEKTTGHAKNSLRRRKRSTNKTLDIQPAGSAPLIVNYETSHDPQPLFKRTANFIQNADLADFNIQTLHRHQPRKQSDEDQPTSKVNDETPLKSEENDRSGERGELNDSRESNESQEKDSYRNDKKPHSSEESAERDPPRRPYKRADSSGESRDDISGERSQELDRGKYNRREQDIRAPFSENYRDSRRKEPYRESGDSREDDTPYKDSNDSKNYERSRQLRPQDSRESKDVNSKESSNENDDRRRSYHRKEHSPETQDSRDSSDSSREDSRSRSPYKTEHSDERKDSRESKSANEDSFNNKKSPYHDNKEKNDYGVSREKSDYRKREESQSQENDSQESGSKYEGRPKFEKALFKAPYTAPSQDSNEGREQIDDALYPRQNSDGNNYNNRDDNKSDYTKPRDENSDSREKAESKENYNAPYEDESPNKRHYSNIIQPIVQHPPKPSESEEQEAIIAVLKRKNFPEEGQSKSAPLAIKDVDLNDFSYERINVNNKGIVETVKDAYETYDTKPKNSQVKDDYQDKSAPLGEFSYGVNHGREKNNKLPIIDVPLVEPFTTLPLKEVEENSNENVPVFGDRIKQNQKSENNFQAKSVPIGDFTYNRNNANDKELTKPARYEKLPIIDVPLIDPLTTFQPIVVQEVNEQLARSSAENPLSSESSEESNRSVPIDDVDVELKPVVEINPEPEQEEHSKEALKEDPKENTSLEALLGINHLDSSDEKSDKIVAQEAEENKGDVKQQFERIPLNYNHDKKQKEIDDKQTKEEPPANAPQARSNDEANVNQGTIDILTPPVPDTRYDEHLNFKFDDVSIKLPEINLPDDILDISYHSDDYKKSPYSNDDYKESPYNNDDYKHAPFEEKKKNKKYKDKEPKKKFYHYNEDYKEENPRKHNDDNADHDDKRNHEHDDEHDHGYHDYYSKDKKKDDYKSKQGNEEEQEEEDLYEKFVRERFGKEGSFEKRSGRLETKPAVDNAKLFESLQSVLHKAQNIEKEAQKSGDPNAAYMWTLEYGQNLN